jgi:hypothetical protein
MLGDTGLIDRDGETFAFLILCRRKLGVYLCGHTHILIHSSLSIV